MHRMALRPSLMEVIEAVAVTTIQQKNIEVEEGKCCVS